MSCEHSVIGMQCVVPSVEGEDFWSGEETDRGREWEDDPETPTDWETGPGERTHGSLQSVRESWESITWSWGPQVGHAVYQITRGLLEGHGCHLEGHGCQLEGHGCHLECHGCQLESHRCQVEICSRSQ